MRQERFCVISEASQDEWSWHYSFEKAKQQCIKLAKQEGIPFRVDWNVVEITRDGVSECIETEPDLFGYPNEA